MANCAAPMIALNTAVANQLIEFKKEVDALIEDGIKKDEAIFQILKKLIVECKNIRFDGNGYSDEWVEEAERRGLTNIKDVPAALDAYLSDKVVDLFTKTGIFSERELEGRTEVEYEKFTKKIQIEARVLGDLAINHIVPTAIQYQTTLIENVKGLRDIFSEEEFTELAAARKSLIKDISIHISTIKLKVNEMVDARKLANKIENEREKAEAYNTQVRPFLDEIRYHIDKLELVVDNELWPLPKYRELLFAR